MFDMFKLFFTFQIFSSRSAVFFCGTFGTNHLVKENVSAQNILFCHFVVSFVYLLNNVPTYCSKCPGFVPTKMP